MLTAPRRVGVVALVGLAVVAAVFAASRRDDDTTDLSSRMLRPLAGLPQDGITLGRPDAPERLAVYTDVTSQEFGSFEADVLPELLRMYVRPGRMAIQMRTWPAAGASGVAGPQDRSLAARAAQAAGLQDRMWQFLAVLWARYPGYLDADVLAQAFRDTPGLQVATARRDLASRRVELAVRRAASRGRRVGLTRPTGFVFDPAGGAPARIVRPARPTAKAFLAALAAAGG